ncbi:hypothetical protein BC826DRAFT_88772 [Russula brevipes]|nr:hypothetical protein BC826DRAFT_88772 [Russula brevipes]
MDCIISIIYSLLLFLLPSLNQSCSSSALRVSMHKAMRHDLPLKVCGLHARRQHTIHKQVSLGWDERRMSCSIGYPQYKTVRHSASCTARIAVSLNRATLSSTRGHQTPARSHQI